MNIIITSGPTREYIDSVRFISNVSTGTTGSALADFFVSKGFRVSALCAANSIKPKNKKVEILEFSDFSNLNSKIKNLLKTRSFDLFIHCAAVSDYSVRSPYLKTKLDSGPGTLAIILKRNFKILDRIKSYAKAKKPYLIAFKLTCGAGKKEILSAVSKLKSADIVVHNDINEKGFFHLYKNGIKTTDCSGHKELARKILKFFKMSCLLTTVHCLL